MAVREPFFQVLGNTNLLKYIVSFQKGVKYDSIKDAVWCIENGHFSLLKEKKDLFYSLSTMDVAVSKGRLDIVQWLHKHHPKTCTINAMDNAASGGYLYLFQWLHYNRTEGCTHEAFLGALRNNHLDVAQWFYAHRTEIKISNLSKSTFQSGSLETVQWVYTTFSSNISFHGFFVDALEAVEHDNLPLIEWIDSKKRYNYKQVMCRSARVGSLQILQWAYGKYKLKRHCIDPLPKCLEVAIFSGQIHIAEWLHAKGATLVNTRIPLWLVENKHIHTLQWYQSKYGISSVEDVINLAIEIHYLEVIVWIHSIYSIPKIFVEENRNNILEDVNLLQWFIDNHGFTLTVEDVDVALEKELISIAEFIFTHINFQCSTKTLSLAIHYDSLYITKKLYKHGTLRHDDLLSITNGDSEVLEWLFFQGELRRCDPYFSVGPWESNTFNKWKCLQTPQSEHFLIFLYACLEEDITFLEWYYGMYPHGVVKDVASFSLQQGLYKVLRWLVKNVPLENYDLLVEEVIVAGDLDIIDFLYNHKPFSLIEKVKFVLLGNYMVMEWFYLRLANDIDLGVRGSAFSKINAWFDTL